MKNGYAGLEDGVVAITYSKDDSHGDMNTHAYHEQMQSNHARTRAKMHGEYTCTKSILFLCRLICSSHRFSLAALSVRGV